MTSMSRVAIALLIVTNLATGYQMLVYKQRLELAVSDRTTNLDRDTYGKGCVDWLNEQDKERGITLTLGRSWKKHGQYVFEIIPDSKEDWKEVLEKVPETELPAMLCTYDGQSGIMVAITGDERDQWMFY